MLKKSKIMSKSTSVKAEVLNISHQGIWIAIDEREYSIPFSDFPWFLKATIEQLHTVELFHDKHLHWPVLDIDIAIESLEHPELYPLKYAHYWSCKIDKV
jgi:Protein of unknown function (DUF2442)